MNKETQIPFITSKGSFLAVRVPDDATSFYLSVFTGILYFSAEIENKIQLPVHCTFITTTNTVTEDQAAALVDFDNDRYYKDYTLSKAMYHLNTALESFSSLLKANNISPLFNWAVLKQN